MSSLHNASISCLTLRVASSRPEASSLVAADDDELGFGGAAMAPVDSWTITSLRSVMSKHDKAAFDALCSLARAMAAADAREQLGVHRGQIKLCLVFSSPTNASLFDARFVLLWASAGAYFSVRLEEEEGGGGSGGGARGSGGNSERDDVLRRALSAITRRLLASHGTSSDALELLLSALSSYNTFTAAPDVAAELHGGAVLDLTDLVLRVADANAVRLPIPKLSNYDAPAFIQRFVDCRDHAACVLALAWQQLEPSAGSLSRRCARGGCCELPPWVFPAVFLVRGAGRDYDDVVFYHKQCIWRDASADVLRRYLLEHSKDAAITVESVTVPMSPHLVLLALDASSTFVECAEKALSAPQKLAPVAPLTEPKPAVSTVSPKQAIDTSRGFNVAADSSASSGGAKKRVASKRRFAKHDDDDDNDNDNDEDEDDKNDDNDDDDDDEKEDDKNDENDDDDDDEQLEPVDAEKRTTARRSPLKRRRRSRDLMSSSFDIVIATNSPPAAPAPSSPPPPPPASRVDAAAAASFSSSRSSSTTTSRPTASSARKERRTRRTRETAADAQHAVQSQNAQQLRQLSTRYPNEWTVLTSFSDMDWLLFAALSNCRMTAEVHVSVPAAAVAARASSSSTAVSLATTVEQKHAVTIQWLADYEQRRAALDAEFAEREQDVLEAALWVADVAHPLLQSSSRRERVTHAALARQLRQPERIINALSVLGQSLRRLPQLESAPTYLELLTRGLVPALDYVAVARMVHDGVFALSRFERIQPVLEALWLLRGWQSTTPSEVLSMKKLTIGDDNDGDDDDDADNGNAATSASSASKASASEAAVLSTTTTTTTSTRTTTIGHSSPKDAVTRARRVTSSADVQQWSADDSAPKASTSLLQYLLTRNNAAEVVASVDDGIARFDLDVDGLRRFCPGEWLSTPSIELILAIINCDLLRRALTDQAEPRAICIGPTFYQLLSRPDAEQKTAHYTKLVRAALTARLPKHDFRLILVVNVGEMHWATVLVDFEHARVTYLDSLAGDGAHVVERVRGYVVDVLLAHDDALCGAFDGVEWRLESTVASSRQTDANNCGVFALLAAEKCANFERVDGDLTALDAAALRATRRLFADRALKHLVLYVDLPEFVRLFSRAASSQTTNGNETLALLARPFNSNRVTHIVLPRQAGSPDMCSMLESGEPALVEYLGSNGLVVAGWIHTHPNHDCFLSGIDMHTAYDFQRMAPHPIASIVVARNDKRRPHVVYGLTTRGVAELAACTRGNKAAHNDHDTPAPGREVYGKMLGKQVLTLVGIDLHVEDLRSARREVV